MADEQFTYLTTAVSSCPPAVRMFAVVAWLESTGVRSEVLPVLAVESRVIAEYAPGADDLEMVGQDVVQFAIVVDPAFGLVAFDDYLQGFTDPAHRLVVASWQASEDACHLEAIVTQLRRELTPHLGN